MSGRSCSVAWNVFLRVIWWRIEKAPDGGHADRGAKGSHRLTDLFACQVGLLFHQRQQEDQVRIDRAGSHIAGRTPKAAGRPSPAAAGAATNRYAPTRWGRDSATHPSRTAIQSLDPAKGRAIPIDKPDARQLFPLHLHVETGFLTRR
jgi:hypothetical protein